jgi:hypothetical protein
LLAPCPEGRPDLKGVFPIVVDVINIFVNKFSKKDKDKASK